MAEEFDVSTQAGARKKLRARLNSLQSWTGKVRDPTPAEDSELTDLSNKVRGLMRYESGSSLLPHEVQGQARMEAAAKEKSALESAAEEAKRRRRKALLPDEVSDVPGAERQLN